MHNIFSKKYLRYLFLVLGLILLTLVIYRSGPQKLFAYLMQLGPYFFVILGISFVNFLSTTLAWRLIVFLMGEKASFLAILRVKICGEAVNGITPLSWAGGDPARIILLKEYMKGSQAAASVTVDRTLNNIGAGIFILIGIFVALFSLSLPQQLKIGFVIALSLIIVSTIFFIVHSHRGLLTFFANVIQKIRIKKQFSEKTWENIRQTDKTISQLYHKNRLGLCCSLSLHFFSRIVAAVEILLISTFLGSGLNFFQSYLILSIGIIINMVFFFIPGRVGVLEGSYQQISDLFKGDPSLGLAIQIIRRTRSIFWSGIGLLLIGKVKKK